MSTRCLALAAECRRRCDEAFCDDYHWYDRPGLLGLGVRRLINLLPFGSRKALP